MKFTGKMRTVTHRMVAGISVFIQDEAGQDLIEYALVACLLALAAVASMKSIGEKLAASFNSVSSSVTSSI